MVPEVEQDHLVGAVEIDLRQDLLPAFLGAAGDDDAHVAGDEAVEIDALGGDRVEIVVADAAHRDREAGDWPPPSSRKACATPGSSRLKR